MIVSDWIFMNVWQHGQVEVGRLKEKVKELEDNNKVLVEENLRLSEQLASMTEHRDRLLDLEGY